MRAARPPAGRERGSAGGSGRRGGQGRHGQGRRGALCRAWLSPAAGARTGGGDASPSAAGSALGSWTAAQSPHGAVGLPRGGSASRELWKGCAESRLRCRPRGTALALARGTGSARPAWRLGAGAERPGRPGLSWGLRGAALAEGSGGARWRLPLSPLLPVMLLPTGLLELGQNRRGGITVGFVSPKSWLKL